MSQQSCKASLPIFLKQTSFCFTYWSIVFYICSKVPCNRDTVYHLWTSVSLPENQNQLGLNLSSPSWPLSPVHCLPSLKFHYRPIDFFFWGGVRFELLLKNISSNMLQKFAHSFLKDTMHNWVRHAYYLYTLPSGVQRVSITLMFKESYLFH